MVKKSSKTMLGENLVSRLIHTYPDSIVKDEYGDLDFDSTIYNFAVDIIDNIPDSQQKSALGQVFRSYEDLYLHLIIYYNDFRNQLEDQINNTEHEN